MPKPGSYEIFNFHSLNEAFEKIGFPVARKKVFFRHRGKNRSINREVIINAHTGDDFEVLSPDYQIRLHKQALGMTLRAFKDIGIPYDIKTIGLDNAGARMLVRFQFQKLFLIGKQDGILPELTLTNSYDGCLGLGFDLGFFRKLGSENAQIKAPGLKARWNHHGDVAGIHDLNQAAKDALEVFEKTVIPLFQDMAQHPLSQELILRAIVRVLEKALLPQRVGKQIIQMAGGLKPPFSIWTLLNAFSWATTHGFIGSPTRRRELEQNIAGLFQDGGHKLILEAGDITEADVRKWREKAEGVAA